MLWLYYSMAIIIFFHRSLSWAGCIATGRFLLIAILFDLSIGALSLLIVGFWYYLVSLNFSFYLFNGHKSEILLTYSNKKSSSYIELFQYGSIIPVYCPGNFKDFLISHFKSNLFTVCHFNIYVSLQHMWQSRISMHLLVSVSYAYLLPDLSTFDITCL